MPELVGLLFHPLSNAVMTVLTGITAVYWLFTMLGGNFFTDAHAHVHGADLDTDTDTDLGDMGGDKSALQKVLDFIHAGKMPFMVVYSIFKFIAWIFTLLSSIIWGLASWGWRSVFILIPVFVLALIVTRYVTKPLVKLYKVMGYNGEESVDLMGRTAKMRSTIQGNTIGAAELFVQSDVIRILVKSKTGEPLPYNSEVMISGESPDKKYYYVVPEVNLANVV